jgi:hypothetical protein
MVDETFDPGDDDEDDRAFFERVARETGARVEDVEWGTRFLDRRHAGLPDLDEDREDLEELADRVRLNMGRMLPLLEAKWADFDRLNLDAEEAKILLHHRARRERAYAVFRRFEDPDAVPPEEMTRLLEEADALDDGSDAKWAAIVRAVRELRRGRN